MKLLNATGLNWKTTDPYAKEKAFSFRVSGKKTCFHYFPSDMSLYSDAEQETAEKIVSPPAPPKLFTAIRPSRIVLVVSEACNLRCEYCYVDDQGRLSPAVMSDQDVCRAIDLCGGKPMAFSFFGGEPLTAWDRIEWAVERALAKAAYLGHDSVKFHVTTNATLLTPERAAYLSKHKFSVLVSLDGPQDLHDRYRRTAGGGATYESVIEGLGMLKDAGVKSVTLRSTFVPDCIEIVKRLEHLNDLCDQGYAGGVAVEPAVGCTDSPCYKKSTGYADDVLTAAFDEGTRWCIARARAGKRARWGLLTKAVDRVLDRKPAFTECGAGKGYAAVRPNGEIHSCHKCVAEIGKLETGIEPGLVQPWIENRLIEWPQCRSCWARFICGGPCRAEAVEDSGQIGVPAVGCRIGQLRAMSALEVVANLAGEPAALANIRFVKGAGSCG